MLTAHSLRTGHLINPIGLDLKSLCLSWQIHTDKNNAMQTAYQIHASNSDSFDSIIWDSKKIASDQSQNIPYFGPALKSMERIYWRVKTWDQKEESEYSQTAFFEIGLKNADWKAKWIEPEDEADPDTYKPAPYLRKEFTVKKDLIKARAYMTAKGVYSFYVNGKLGTDDLFTPGATSYHKRLQYQAYDITDLLTEGENTLGIILGDGWWRGSTGGNGFKNNFGYKLAFLGQLVLTYANGSHEIIASDSSFKTSLGPILKSDFKAGEIYDARNSLEGWNKPGFEDFLWKKVHVTQDGVDCLIASKSVPVKAIETYHPEVLTTPNGEKVLDFGQNIFGWVEMTVQGSEGTEVWLEYGEILNKDGNFTTDNLVVEGVVDPEDFQKVCYVLSGKGVEQHHPLFAAFGFRYVLVRNYPGEVRAENFISRAIYSAMEETGSFKCSNPLINQLVSNSRWSQKGNFVDIPTDCPTRERAGWTGDAQVYCRTAADFMNVYTFFEKWTADLAAEQFKEGQVPNTVPNAYGYHNKEEVLRVAKNSLITDPMLLEGPGVPYMTDSSTGWGDASVIIPWTMYLCYGDKNILENQYPSAKAWVDYMDISAKNRNDQYKNHPAYKNFTDSEVDGDYIYDTGFHYGEWLEADYDLDEFVNAADETMAKMFNDSDPIVATAYFAYSSRLLSEIAAVLGKKEDEEKYRQLFAKIKRVYNKYFIADDGNILDDRQAPYIRVLAFDLVEEGKKQAVINKLVEVLKANDYHLNTGFLSTPFILEVLADNGHLDIAYKVLEQETSPSWLYNVKSGATTILETWKGIENGTYSHNHYAFGAVCDFLFSRAAGIQPMWKTPGYKHFLLKPHSGGSLTEVEAVYESAYGTIKSSWKKCNTVIDYSFTIPPNTAATIILPIRDEEMEAIKSIYSNAVYEEGYVVLEFGCGIYKISTKI
ncbi:MAG: family 78 glycoside hydrolase catalytic domain [Lachnospiraceae bacterium]